MQQFSEFLCYPPFLGVVMFVFTSPTHIFSLHASPPLDSSALLSSLLKPWPKGKNIVIYLNTNKDQTASIRPYATRIV